MRRILVDYARTKRRVKRGGALVLESYDERAGAVAGREAALVIGRDLAIVLGAGVAWMLDLPMRIAPLPLGKATTAMQIAYIALMLMFLLTGFSDPQMAAGMAIAVAVVTLASGLNYAAIWLKALVIRTGRPA